MREDVLGEEQFGGEDDIIEAEWIEWLERELIDNPQEDQKPKSFYLEEELRLKSWLAEKARCKSESDAGKEDNLWLIEEFWRRESGRTRWLTAKTAGPRVPQDPSVRVEAKSLHKEAADEVQQQMTMHATAERHRERAYMRRIHREANVGELAEQMAAWGRAAMTELLDERRFTEASHRTWGPDPPEKLRLLTGTLARQRRVLEAAQRILGPDHPDVFGPLCSVTVTLRALGRGAEAEPLLWSTLEEFENTWGADSLITQAALVNVSRTLTALGYEAEAEPLAQRALDIALTFLGPENPGTVIAERNLAQALSPLGRKAEAEVLFRHVYTSYEATLGKMHKETLTIREVLIEVFTAQGKDAEAGLMKDGILWAPGMD